MKEESRNEQKLQLDDESEFGKGLAYCLGLFLAHTERYGRLDKEFIGKETMEKFPLIFSAEMWFNGSSDHLYELQVDSAPLHLQARLRRFQSQCLRWGHGFNPEFQATEADKEWAIEEAKFLLMAIDQHNNIPTKKGRWE